MTACVYKRTMPLGRFFGIKVNLDFIISVLEGLSLLDYGISPYTGDTVHEVTTSTIRKCF